MKKLSTGQTHENDAASLVVVCAPSALSKMMGSLHPAGALYQKPVNLEHALSDHAEFVTRLRRTGADVRDVRSILTDRVDWCVGDRIALENLAFNCLKYEYLDTGDLGTETLNPPLVHTQNGQNGHNGQNGEKNGTEEPDEYYVSDVYKRAVIEAMGVEQLVDVVFTNPTISVTRSLRDTGFVASYSFSPLSNIVFVRDQQITTRRGIVMARLRSPQRQRETDILEFCFRKLGLDIVGRVPSPGFLEGGDFFPLGEGLCLVGIGPRSDWTAVKYLMERDILGTERVAVVRDDRERRQERMHLDTVFNVVGEKVCVMLDEMMGAGSETRRVVDVYARDWDEVRKAKAVGGYVLVRKDVEFAGFMREEGFEIIAVGGSEQLKYGCNLLNVGNGNVICTEMRTARQIARCEKFEGRVQYLEFGGVSNMYGGIHCSSQVVVRNKAKQGKCGEF